MSFAFFPWYTGDYLRDTRHLTPQKHGVYLLLLAHCWDQKGPVPLDEQEAAGIANCRSADEIDSLRYILGRYFVRMEDGWYNNRIADEIARAEAKSAHYRENGLKSAAARRAKVRGAIAEQRLNNGSAAVGTPTPTPTPMKDSKDESPTGSSPRGGPAGSEAAAALAAVKAESKRAPPCPHDRIIAAYHACLPTLPRLLVRNEQRDRLLAARWRQAFADGKATTAAEGLQFFEEFFQYVADSQFLTGRAPGRAGSPPFIADLEWLMRPTNYAKTIEGRYHRG